MPEGAIGPYQLLGPIGAGGMGEVYRALDPRIGRQVALKLLPQSLVNDAERRRRFEQEARLAASLNHPNVMAIYDVGLDQDPPYIVAELVSGESLRALIAAGPLAPRKAVDIAAQIAAGFAAAHAAGIVHRDLKPENVIVTPEGSPRCSISAWRAWKSKAATANETVTMAQHRTGRGGGDGGLHEPRAGARASDVDYRSDQFSLGLVLYEMLTGKQAFARAQRGADHVGHHRGRSAADRARVCPRSCAGFWSAASPRSRRGRYESTRDLARELATLRDHFGELTSGATGSTGGRRAGRARFHNAAFRGEPAAACALAAVAAWSAAQLCATRTRSILRATASRRSLPSW